MNIPNNISKKAQLIEGVGASSWFTICKEESHYRIERFSIDGKKECSKLFSVTPTNFNINKAYRFTYISHCKECTLIQQKKTFKFYLYEN